MTIQTLPIHSLRPAPYNPRKDLTPEDVEYRKIKRSVEEFGYVDPVIVNADMTVIGGHQRLKVLQDLGYTDIECVVVDMDKDREKALNIALNKISGEWDFPRLKDLLQELDTGAFDVELTGFDFAEIEELLGQVHQEDVEEMGSTPTPQPRKPPRPPSPSPATSGFLAITAFSAVTAPTKPPSTGSWTVGRPALSSPTRRTTSTTRARTA